MSKNVQISKPDLNKMVTAKKAHLTNVWGSFYASDLHHQFKRKGLVTRNGQKIAGEEGRSSKPGEPFKAHRPNAKASWYFSYSIDEKSGQVSVGYRPYGKNGKWQEKMEHGGTLDAPFGSSIYDIRAYFDLKAEAEKAKARRKEARKKRK